MLVLELAFLLSGAGRPPLPRANPARHSPVKEQSLRAAQPTLESIPDLDHAVPAQDLSKLPSASEQYRQLQHRLATDRPLVDSAREKSEALKSEALSLQQKLIATAARIELLETEKQQLDEDIARLAAQDSALSAGFERDRISVARLLAILERLQHDMPPAMALKPDDALGAARGAMLVGASLPNVYGQAAALARRIAALQKTRAALIARRAEGQRNAQRLSRARVDLDQLFAKRQREAGEAASRYGDLKQKLDLIASQAGDLEALLAKVASLRRQPAEQSVVVVSAQKSSNGPLLRPGSLLPPVVGHAVPTGPALPGMTFATAPGAQVIAPADGRVLFAGAYHKNGQVLILEMAGGYDVVLAGLERVDVRPEDEVLAGEPVGTMAKIAQEQRLYFELRQNGRGHDPSPWLVVDVRKAKRT